MRAPAIRSETPLAAPHAARTGSAGRLQAMADASARVRQLAGLAALARARVPGAAPIQRRRIHEGLTSFLSGAAPDEARLRAYVDRYEIAGMAQMARDYCTDDTLAKAVPTAFAAMRTTTLAAKGGTGTWTAAATALETLVAAINAAFAQSKAPSGYEASDKANWGGVDAAVKGAEAAVATGTPGRKPERKGVPEIRTIAFSSAKSTFPAPLWRLLRDIYGSWRQGGILDERDDDERANRTLNSDTPGALRSWHMNAEGSLPAHDKGDTPDRTAAFETHYQDTSGTMNKLGSSATGPVGFAEYTGTGILDDKHNSKVVLDYKRGEVYLTLTHYQYWKKEGERVTSQGQVEGDNNPWYRVDMNA